MRTFAWPVCSLLALLCVQATAEKPAEGPAKIAQCRITQADLLANRALSWSEFDQQTGSVTSWRSLIERKCEDAAVLAYTDYLAFGPIPKGERWQSTARFHLGQSLAHKGRYQEAALLMATARRETEVGGMKWNLYVQGTYAFLTRDKASLDAAFAELSAEPGHSNAVNTGVLAGLRHCWNRPYRDASAPACVTASGYVPRAN